MNRWLLPAMCAALALVVGGIASLFVALPDIGRSTGASQTELNWVTNAYAVAFSSLLLAGGAVGDRVGRRPVLVAGLLVYSAAVGWAALQADLVALIAGGALAGVGAACVMPVTLSVLTTSYPEEERGRATGIWAGVASAAGVGGMLLGGLVLEVLDWPWIYGLIGVLGVAIAGLCAAVVPASRDADAPPLDRTGIGLSVAAAAVLVFSVVEAPEAGWTAARTLAGLVAGLVLAALFVRHELRTAEPMLDVRLFASRGFSAGSGSVLLQFFAAFGFWFLSAQYFQVTFGWSPLQAAAALFPMGVGILAVAPFAPALADRVGHRLVMPAGLALMAGGLLVLAPLDAGSGYGHVVAGLLPFGVGFGLAVAPGTTLITRSLPPERQGVASAVNDSSREIGGALGLAVLGSLLTTRYDDGVKDVLGGLPAPVRDAVASSAITGQQALERLGPRGAEAARAVTSAYADGWWLAMAVSAGVLLAAAVLVGLRAPRPEREPAPAGDADRRVAVPAGR